MSVDRRIREGLTRLASEVDVAPAPALQVVRNRARRRARVVRSAQVLAVAVVTALAVTVAPPVVDRFRQGGRSSVVQPAGPLMGTYIVDLPDSLTNRRAGVVGRWIVTLRTDDVLELTPPPGFVGAHSGSNYRIQNDTLRTDALVNSPGCQATGVFVGTYRWVRDGSAVRFDLVSDTCPARIALFTGQVWEVAS